MINYKKHKYRGKLHTARELSVLAGYSYSNVVKLLQDGYTPEQIVKKEHYYSKVTDRKNRKVPLFHFRRIEDLCTHLGIKRQRLYQRIARGDKLEEVNGKIQFV